MMIVETRLAARSASMRDKAKSRIGDYFVGRGWRIGQVEGRVTVTTSVSRRALGHHVW